MLGKTFLKRVKKSCESTNIPALEILRKVEKPTPDASSYRVIIAVIEWTIMFAFLFLAAYASYRHTL